MLHKSIWGSLSMFVSIASIAQNSKHKDTLQTKALDSITVVAYQKEITQHPLPPVKGTYIFSGKKTESINLLTTPADISNKTARQVFAKVPGIFVYDMDGSGNQVNISARGLDPHRGWEFNIRKDGILTNSDMYGYPASHFSMPLESIERIELVRGTGSLQYGAQFGGMLNYVSKKGDTSQTIGFENITTAGSYNLLSNYTAIGGQVGKLNYYAYYQRKSREGYRDNDQTRSEAQGIMLTYQFSTKISLKMDWARSQYRYRIPGALTDSMFYADPTQATRSRNYFSPDIHIPSLTLNWNISNNTELLFTTSSVLGNRSSVLFDKPTNVRDTINIITNNYNNRQVDIDNFHSYTSEIRILHQYQLGNQRSFLTGGIQYMNNDLHRRQLGKGTTGSEYDLTLVTPGWGRDVHLKTSNISLFAENRFQLFENLSVGLGGRIEMGETNMSGKITYYPDNQLPVSIPHHFPLFGINFNYRPVEFIDIYGGWSQSYHPMYFKDLIPSSTFEKVDPNIKDADGYNMELGTKGSWKFLRWDVNAFLLRYNNRFGILAQTDNNGNFITYRTNIGNSVTKGLEIFIQADWLLAKRTYLSIYTSTAIFHSRYESAVVKSGNTNINIGGNEVEGVPHLISRNGASIRYRNLSASFLYSYTGASFADALNTYEPLKTTGAVGRVPSYALCDASVSIHITNYIEARASINNIFDHQYFTKRPSFYPGPGVWPSDGRNMTGSLIIKI